MRSWIPPLVFGFSAGASVVLALQGTWASFRDDNARRYAEVRDFVRENAVRVCPAGALSTAALRGLAASIDGYSRYLDRGEAQALERETDGRYRGIGAVFRSPVSSGQVLFTMPGGPAMRAGLQPGDRIVRADGMLVDTLSEAGLRETLSCNEPPSIRLEVQALTGTSREVEVQKASIVDPTVRHEELLDAVEHIGYVSLCAFSHETAAEFDAAVDSLVHRGARSLILDLRGNPGGVLLAAVEVARRFISEGALVTTEGREHRSTQFLAERSRAWYEGLPLVVMIDERSASASEVLAGALQDHRACVVLGARSYGKGTVQTIRRFPETGGIAKVTSSFYFTPGHRCLERTEAPDLQGGIEPDYVVTVTPEEQREVHAFLARYSPPPEQVEALRAWEALEHVKLLEERPADTQLEAALHLLRGEGLPASGVQ